MTYSKLIGDVADELLKLLAPIAGQGATVKHATDATLDIGAKRTACCYVLVPSVASGLTFDSGSGLQTTGTGRATVKAYLLCCGFELKAPKGIYWLLEEAEAAVSGRTVLLNGCEVVVHSKGSSFTKSEAGYHQYRIELDLQVPISMTTDWRRSNVS